MIRRFSILLGIFFFMTFVSACEAEPEHQAGAEQAEIDEADLAEIDEADPAEIDEADEPHSVDRALGLKLPTATEFGGIICGEKMCCDTSPSGSCWPKPSEEPQQ
ncbi:hypothetical protein [Nannocystis pusilla]|uniref:hypothetical protein n=1 Tax=Nannocystis pusilla TaxID=889268 RepID=UPI003BF2FDDF